MKKVFNVVATVLAVASIIVISIGIILYNQNKDIIKGCYFRKMYGSIGIVAGDEYIINMNVFCFDSDIDFMKNVNDLCFDNPDVSIKSIDITVHDQKGDLIIYNLCMRLSVDKDGQSNITTLMYSDGSTSSTYEIGNIAFMKYNENSIYFAHGCDLYFIKNQAIINFCKSNETGFTVTDLIYAESDMYTCSYDKELLFTPGHELICNLNVETSYDDRDIFLFQPIFVIKLENDSKNYYFVSSIPFCNARYMTFSDIREYVK